MTKFSSVVARKLGDLPLILGFDLRAMWYPALLVPLLLGATLAVLVGNDVLALQIESDKQVWMDSFETAAVWLLTAAAVVAGLRLVLQRRLYFVWLAVLMGSLLCREIRFEWSNMMVHVSVAALMLAAWWFYGAMANYFTSRVVVTLLVSMFACYVLTQMLDQRWLKFLPGEKLWEKQTEEAIECGGHVFAVLLTVFSRRGRLPSPLASAKQAEPAGSPAVAVATETVSAE
ncbi:MAG: hypothetical protein ACYS8X_09985 [Planctomycetota bacterium]|jgi:hypothetical protein